MMGIALKRRGFCRLLVGGSHAGAWLAGAAIGRAADLPAPARPIAALNAALLAAMKAGPTESFASRAAALQPVVERAFDLPAILRASVGSRWAGFSAVAQGALLEAFTRFTVASWTANFDRFDGERFEVLPEMRQVGAEQVVESQIVPRQGTPTRLDYVMRDSGDAWKAVDVLVDGAISRVATQRSDFRSLLTSGDPAPLLAMLRHKADALAAGGGS
jgi:phospholipid transport system substrate-binding protein